MVKNYVTFSCAHILIFFGILLISCVFFLKIGGYLFCTFHIILMDFIFVNCECLAHFTSKCFFILLLNFQEINKASIEKNFSNFNNINLQFV